MKKQKLVIDRETGRWRTEYEERGKGKQNVRNLIPIAARNEKGNMAINYNCGGGKVGRAAA